MNLGQLDLNLLVVLDALLREQNVTRAAARLHLSQPATSTALARLRRILDDPLLVKQGRYLRLTPRGEALIEPVREVLATIEQQIVAPPGFDPAHDERTFTVMASDYAGVVLMRPLLERVNGAVPNIRLELGALSADAARMIERDEIDLVILPEVLADDLVWSSCSHASVLRDRYVGAVWSQHPLADGSLSLQALAEYPYLAFAPPSGCSLMDEDLERAGVTPRVEATSVTFITMPFLLAGTDLVTIIPESLGQKLTPAADITLLEPEFPLRPVRESVYWHSRREGDPGHRWLREQLLAVAG
ncbi:LysR family transcriptional regulator [Amycolatopsis jiangsuensis]|uniref:DNA-binding transcriptional LysR family regulator n=1 Tax=Amycolatopsis jiangsuensis TaxID=1181879 RepID=A0A840ILF4_9PSEU|nr:LysR family transcriptional regulator [Amycolatopsis jiangsuensis]MBB4683151.1 DNA-binding transcriptional LysR family regulator [Amycolatopsis jiangsuensis]